LLDHLGPTRRPALLRGDKSWGIERVMSRVEQNDLACRAIARGVKMGRPPKMTPHQINLNPAVGLIGAYSFEAFYNRR
jgi:hypothetical protein